MSARVLVTGSSGFTGRYVVPLLLQRGHSVLGVEEESAGVRPYDVFQFDLSGNTAGLIAELRRFDPTHVLHLAALSHVANSSPSAYYAVNVVGTENLLKAVRQGGVNVRRIVLAGTANVYGNVTESPIGERQEPAPQNHYSFSKLVMERLANSWFPDLPVVVTRPFNYTGVGQREDFLVPKIVGHFARRAPLIRLGNIDVARDISDVRFVAEVYCRLLECTTDVRVLNVCSGRSIMLRSILLELERLTGHQCGIEVDQALVRKQEIAELHGDDTLLRRVLPGLMRPPTFRETLEWMYGAAVESLLQAEAT